MYRKAEHRFKYGNYIASYETIQLSDAYHFPWNNSDGRRAIFQTVNLRTSESSCFCFLSVGNPSAKRRIYAFQPGIVSRWGSCHGDREDITGRGKSEPPASRRMLSVWSVNDAYRGVTSQERGAVVQRPQRMNGIQMGSPCHRAPDLHRHEAHSRFRTARSKIEWYCETGKRGLRMYGGHPYSEKEESVHGARDNRP